MALTTAGRSLTQQHKLEQIRLGTRFVAASQVLLGELNPAQLDGTVMDWLPLQVLLGEAFHRDSANLAAAYLSEYRAAEAGRAGAAMPIIRPTFDAATATDKASLLVPMAKTATAGGLTAKAAVDKVFWTLVNEWRTGTMAGGRDLVDASTLANQDSIGWRRVTDGNPCTWCAMLATRGPAYQSAETAGEGRFYHDRCGCTAEEVFGEWVPTAEEQRYIDLYEASHEPGMSASETTAAMRENGQGVVNDATKPATQQEIDLRA